MIFAPHNLFDIYAKTVVRTTIIVHPVDVIFYHTQPFYARTDYMCTIRWAYLLARVFASTDGWDARGARNVNSLTRRSSHQQQLARAEIRRTMRHIFSGPRSLLRSARGHTLNIKLRPRWN